MKDEYGNGVRIGNGPGRMPGKSQMRQNGEGSQFVGGWGKGFEEFREGRGGGIEAFGRGDAAGRVDVGGDLARNRSGGRAEGGG